MVCLLVVVTRVQGVSTILTGKSNAFGKKTKKPRNVFPGFVRAGAFLVFAASANFFEQQIKLLAVASLTCQVDFFEQLSVAQRFQ